jgi:hypothetical protein
MNGKIYATKMRQSGVAASFVRKRLPPVDQKYGKKYTALICCPLIVTRRMPHMERKNFMAPHLSGVQDIPFGIEEY